MLIAGVMTPSPTSSDIPMKERMTTPPAGPSLRSGVKSSRSTIVPPSPRLPSFHGQPSVLHRHKKNERPENERRTPITSPESESRQDDDGDSVDRARADVAEHENQGPYDSFSRGCSLSGIRGMWLNKQATLLSCYDNHNTVFLDKKQGQKTAWNLACGSMPFL